MKPEEKVKELIDKFKPLVTIWNCYDDIPVHDEVVEKDAAKCAIILCDEVLDIEKRCYEMGIYNNLEYWQQVKAIISNQQTKGGN